MRLSGRGGKYIYAILEFARSTDKPGKVLLQECQD